MRTEKTDRIIMYPNRGLFRIFHRIAASQAPLFFHKTMSSFFNMVFVKT